MAITDQRNVERVEKDAPSSQSSTPYDRDWRPFLDRQKVKRSPDGKRRTPFNAVVFCITSKKINRPARFHSQIAVGRNVIQRSFQAPHDTKRVEIGLDANDRRGIGKVRCMSLSELASFRQCALRDDYVSTLRSFILIETGPELWRILWRWAEHSHQH